MRPAGAFAFLENPLIAIASGGSAYGKEGGEEAELKWIIDQAIAKALEQLAPKPLRTIMPRDTGAAMREPGGVPVPGHEGDDYRGSHWDRRG